MRPSTRAMSRGFATSAAWTSTRMPLCLRRLTVPSAVSETMPRRPTSTRCLAPCSAIHWASCSPSAPRPPVIR